MPVEEEVAKGTASSVQKEVRTRMKQGEAKKQPWEPMQLRCVGHIGEVVEAAGTKAPDVDLDRTLTPPTDPEPDAIKVT